MDAYTEMYGDYDADKSSKVSVNIIPPRIAAWCPMQVSQWVARPNDDMYRPTSTAPVKPNLAYYSNTSRSYCALSDMFLEQGITGSMLLALTEKDLSTRLRFTDKYQIRSFLLDVNNLRLQLS